MDEPTLHTLARCAFVHMNDMACDAKYATLEFNERQYVFELGMGVRAGELGNGSPAWTAYEYRYPGQNERSRNRCDIVEWRPGRPGSRGHYTWLEVKSTGLDDYGYFKNRFGSFEWEHDFDKLESTPDGAWVDAQHEMGWIWLYHFEGYREKVERAFGAGKRWVGPSSLPQMAGAFGRPVAGRMTLATLLHRIHERAPSASVSILPHVRQDKDYSAGDYSVMVVTAVVG